MPTTVKGIAELEKSEPHSILAFREFRLIRRVRVLGEGAWIREQHQTLQTDLELAN